MSTRDKSSSKKRRDSERKVPFFTRIDRRWPWLKLVVVVVVGLTALADLMDLTISKVRDPDDRIRRAPMSKHVEIPLRTLEGKKLVALTFDDGPLGTTTPTLLGILKDRDVPATFFMLGNMASRDPELVKQVSEAGHEIASHTMRHQSLTSISAAAVESDIAESRAVFREILGYAPELVRPPYGNFNDTVRPRIKGAMILWSVDTLDWKYRNTKSIVSTAMSQVYDGAIILMHDIHPTSVEAVPSLIDTLRDAGYEFTTVSELAEIRGVELTRGVAYYGFRP